MTTTARALSEPRSAVSVCSVCGAEETRVFLEVPQVPVHVGVLHREAASARACARGDLTMEYCRRCDHIANRSFDPTKLDYSQEYDNALHNSAVFRSFEEDLVRRLTARGDFTDRMVVEVGPGDGQFLDLVCRAASARGLGFEPGLAGAHVLSADGSVEIRGTEFSGQALPAPVELLCCRHVLEHLEEPRRLLEQVHSALSDTPRARIYLEVPNAESMLDRHDVWDLVYEHRHYFTPHSLRQLLESVGFSCLEAWTPYEGQFLSLEARLESGGSPAPFEASSRGSLEPAVDEFAGAYIERVSSWRRRLADAASAGRRTVLWGGGARAVSFLNALSVGGDLDYVVDVNPVKQGTFVAGTGHEIRPPEVLREAPPDLLVVMNRIYLDEIRGQLRSLELSPEVVAA
jgi:hypothetical protein